MQIEPGLFVFRGAQFFAAKVKTIVASLEIWEVPLQNGADFPRK